MGTQERSAVSEEHAEIKVVAVLGLGEAGSTISRDLVAAGVAVRGYDPAAAAPEGVVATGGGSQRLHLAVAHAPRELGLGDAVRTARPAAHAVVRGLASLGALDARREGIGRVLVASAVAGTLATGTCEWLHVDFDGDLQPFYFDACGFTPVDAGLMALR